MNSCKNQFIDLKLQEVLKNGMENLVRAILILQ